MFEVRNYSFSGSFIFMVRQIELLGRLSHNFRDFCVVHVADVRKNMMLYLVVQSASKPIHDFVFGTEIDRGKQLVNGPGIFHGSSFIWKRRFGILNDVCQLENHA